MKNVLKYSLIIAFALAIAPSSDAQTAEERGLEIATEADKRDTGFKDNVVELRMTLRNSQGQESTRKLQTSNLEVDGEGDKSLVVFDEPRDIKGTAFLSFTHKTGPDDQWLYLPALKRVKRISSNNKSGPFMGSEFAYEDISSQEVEKYTYKFIREETVGNTPMFVVERYPVDRKSGYTRQIVWYDQAEYRLQKIEFYDRKDALLKTLVYDGYQQYLGKYWRADRMSMENHQTGKSTELLFSNYEFQTGLKDKDFNKNSLSRTK